MTDEEYRNRFYAINQNDAETKEEHVKDLLSLRIRNSLGCPYHEVKKKTVFVSSSIPSIFALACSIPIEYTLVD
jgi:hypothetical protein